MPTVSGTLKTFDQVGKREDVEDIIYDISPTDTPMLTSIGTSTAGATLHQWLQDSLAPVATNASVEGADAGTASTVTQTVKTANTQIFDKVVQVSGTAEAVGTYGRTSDLAYAIAKAGKEIKRDIEHSFVGAGQQEPLVTAPTARQLTSAANQISTATTNAAAGSNRALAESLILGRGTKSVRKRRRRYADAGNALALCDGCRLRHGLWPPARLRQQHDCCECG